MDMALAGKQSFTPVYIYVPKRYIHETIGDYWGEFCSRDMGWARGDFMVFVSLEEHKRVIDALKEGESYERARENKGRSEFMAGDNADSQNGQGNGPGEGTGKDSVGGP